ncbi:MAG: hypothetical protein LBT30_07555 [Clostridiales bacterium]|jgi:hypothetical protein|nr:hypothetical protein [Clostridiales bacterium]
MKKVIIITSIVIFGLSVLGVCGYYGYKWLSGHIYDGGDIDSAYEQGRKEAQEYRDYIDNLIAALQLKINEEGSSGFDDIDAYYSGLLSDLEAQLQVSGADIDTLASQKIATLNSLKSSLENMRASYSAEFTLLNADLSDIDIAIGALEALGGGVTAELLGYQYTRNYLLSQIDAVENIIGQLDVHISAIDAQIEALG